MNAFYSGIHGPGRKIDTIPSAQPHFLKMSPHRYAHERSDQVVGFPQKFVEKPSLLAEVSRVAFATQILNHISGIERELNPLRFHPHLLKGIGQLSDWTPGSVPLESRP